MTGIIAKRHLNPVRNDRTYPRVVKRARHNSYRVKRRTDRGIRRDRPATVPRPSDSPTRYHWHSPPDSPPPVPATMINLR
jgi:hypothetical protein